MRISVAAKGNFHKLEAFLSKMRQDDLYLKLDALGRQGVQQLAAATPKDSGDTAASWDYRVYRNPGQSTVKWFNYSMAGETPVVILLQYGHGTGTGGWVQGYDFINPAIRGTMDQIAEEVWKAVVSA